MAHLVQYTELVRSQKATIIKLPAHTPDVLQSFDVKVFKSLKDYWTDILFKQPRVARSQLSKVQG